MSTHSDKAPASSLPTIALWRQNSDLLPDSQSDSFFYTSYYVASLTTPFQKLSSLRASEIPAFPDSRHATVRRRLSSQFPTDSPSAWCSLIFWPKPYSLSAPPPWALSSLSWLRQPPQSWWFCKLYFQPRHHHWAWESEIQLFSASLPLVVTQNLLLLQGSLLSKCHHNLPSYWARNLGDILVFFFSLTPHNQITKLYCFYNTAQ